MPMTSFYLRSLAPPLTVLAAIAVCYSSALQNGYIWDDWYLFIHNPALRLEQVAWKDISAPVLDGTTYFRPVVFLSFWLEFRLLGVDSSWSHAVNLLIHLSSVLLVYLLSLRLSTATALSRPELRASVAAAVYGLHPALVESVAWASGRFDLLATAFTLLALHIDATVRRNLLRTVLLGITFSAALGSKEVAVALPVALLIQRLIVERAEADTLTGSVTRIVTANWLSVVVLVGVFSIYLSLRYLSFHQFFHINDQLPGLTNSMRDRVVLVFGTLIFYIKSIGYPFSTVGPLHPLVAADLKGWIGVSNVVAGTAVVIAIGIGATKRRSIPLLLCGALVALAPVLNLIPLTIANNIGHDRFLTLPLTFCAVAVSQLKFPTWEIVSARTVSLMTGLLIAVWVAGAALITRTAVAQWKDDFTLWSWAYRSYPESLYSQIQVTSAAIALQRYDIATYLFDRLRAKGPLDANLQLSYGGMLIATGVRVEGRKYVEGALIAFPQFHKMSAAQTKLVPFGASRNTEVAFAYRMLAIADLEEGHFEKALENAEVALWYKPTYPLFMVTKAFALLGLDRQEEAGKLIDTAVKLALPDDRKRFRSDLAYFIKDTCSVRPHKSPRLCSSLGEAQFE